MTATHQPIDVPPSDRHTARPAEIPSDEVVIVTDPRRQRMILVAMCVALVAVIASVSGLNVAQRDLAVSLGASQSTLLWIINGYTMVLAALLMPVGAIGDRWGRKTVLLAGLTLFTAANIGAAVASTATLMLLARLAAGAGAAMIMPVTLSVITSSFPAHERAKAVGVWAGFAGAGGILGLFFSSAMVDWFSWRWLFAMPIALSAVGFVMTSKFVANSREHHTGRFDVVGSVLSALAIGMVVMGIHEGPEKGWSAPITVAGLGVGVPRSHRLHRLGTAPRTAVARRSRLHQPVALERFAQPADPLRPPCSGCSWCSSSSCRPSPDSPPCGLRPDSSRWLR